MRIINEIVVHCTATPEGRVVSVAEIRRWHKERGWADIGYHFVVHLDGKIDVGRPVSQVGAHVAGRNANTIGVTYVGGVDKAGKPKDTRTTSQKIALLQLLKRLISQYEDIKLVSGHRDYANKACPSFDARTEYAALTKARNGVDVYEIEPAQTIADGADPLPWWQKSPVLRQVVNTAGAAGITGGAVLGIDYRAIIVLAVVVGIVAITALIIQARKKPSTEGMM